MTAKRPPLKPEIRRAKALKLKRQATERGEIREQERDKSKETP